IAFGDRRELRQVLGLVIRLHGISVRTMRVRMLRPQAHHGKRHAAKARFCSFRGRGATLPRMGAIAEGLRRVLELDRELWYIVVLSLEVSLSAVLIATALGLPLGALLAVKRFAGRRTVIVLLNALMGLPPVVVGLLIYLLLSRAGPLGELGLLFTPGAMVIAQSVLVLPIIAALARQTLEDAWREYEEQLRSLGARELEAAFTLIWDARFSLVPAGLPGPGRAAARGRPGMAP